MEVVGDATNSRDNSVWATPLLLDQKQHMTSSLHKSESAPLSIFDAYVEPTQRRTDPKVHHVRSHSINQCFDLLGDQGQNDHVVDMGFQAMLDDDNDQAPTPPPPLANQEHTSNIFADGALSTSSLSASSGVQETVSASPTRVGHRDHPSALSQLLGQGPPASSSATASNSLSQRPPTQPTSQLSSFGVPRRHPSRSVSSIELAAILNGSAGQSRGVSAVPAHVSGTAARPSSRNVFSSHHGQSEGENGADSSDKGASVKWQKSVFDMIQDDFPRTPSPMLSSLLSTSRSMNTASELRASFTNPRIPPAERRARGSSSSLSVDPDGVGGVDAASDLVSSLAISDAAPRRSLPQRSHRRSVSVNWIGDIPGLTNQQPIAQSASRSTLSSSQSSSFFSGQASQAAATASSSVTQPARESSAISDGGASVPSLSSVPAPGSRPPASAAAAAAAAAAAVASSPNASGALASGSLRNPLSNGSNTGIGNNQLPAHISSSTLERSMSPEAVLYGRQQDSNVSSVQDYNFLYDHHDSHFAPQNIHQPGVHANPVHPGLVEGHLPGDTQNFGGLHSTAIPPSIAASSPYSGAFPAFGMVSPHTPFSNNASALNNGTSLPPSYAHSVRDDLAAAGNIKNMTMQMAAFISAQHQFYAAQMAQVCALTGNTSFNGSSGLFGNPNTPNMFNGQMSAGGQGHQVRSQWDVRGERQVSPHRTNARNKSYSEGYKSSSVNHLSSGSKRGSTSEYSGSKGRSGRGRRGHRMHDEGGTLGSHKMSDRSALAGNLGNGSSLDAGHSRSQLLEEFRLTSSSIGRGMVGSGDMPVGGSFGNANGNSGAASSGTREWQLSEIRNHVVEFATDQHGSRFIQQKLESASKEDKMAVLKQALTDAQRLMTDVFGNYVVQKLLDHGGSEAVASISSELEGRMLSLSLHMYGCRVVQKALEVLEPASRGKLVHELNGHVLKCIRDQNGNHVIQKCVELVESDSVQFIVDAVQGQAVILAGHSYGCRVVQRILEHGPPHQKDPIMSEIMASIPNLIKDQYGNYVIQHVVEHGTPQERSVIMELVKAEVCQLSQHKFASNVVERCLQFGSLEEREILIEILIVGNGTAPSSPLNHLVRDQFGNYVVQRVLDVARPSQRERVVNILKAQVPAIKKYSYGKHIIARLEEQTAGGQHFQQEGRQSSSNGSPSSRHVSSQGGHKAERVNAEHTHQAFSHVQNGHGEEFLYTTH